jgi:hypothetical protein
VIQRAVGSSATVQSPDLRLRLANGAGLVEEQAWTIRDLHIRPEPLLNPTFRTRPCAESDFPDQAYYDITIRYLKY